MFFIVHQRFMFCAILYKKLLFAFTIAISPL